jgi:hypothetical protein
MMAELRATAKAPVCSTVDKATLSPAQLWTTPPICNPLSPLPDELILEICEHIFPDIDLERRQSGESVPHERATFAALARTCRYLHPFALRYLYRVYEFPYSAEHLGFAKTILSNPDLPLHIREVYALGFAIERHKDPLSIDISTIKAEISRLALPYKQRWLEGLIEDPASVEFAFMLWRCRKSLEALEPPPTYDESHRDEHVEWASQDLPVWFDPIFQHRQPGQHVQLTDHGFAKLRYLDVDMTGMSLGHLACLMTLPSLKKLGMKRFNRCNERAREEDWTWRLDQRSSGISCMYIHQSTIPSAIMSSMLRSSKSIKRFRYSAFQNDSEEDPAEFSRTLLEALFKHHKSLQELELDDWDFGRDETSIHRFRRTIDFSKMKMLEELQISYAMLVAKPGERGDAFANSSFVDIAEETSDMPLRSLLPPSLRQLRLMCDIDFLDSYTDHDANLRALLPATGSVSTALTCVDIEHKHRDSLREFPLSFVSLEEEFKSHGINFKYSISRLILDLCK